MALQIAPFVAYGAQGALLSVLLYLYRLGQRLLVVNVKRHQHEVVFKAVGHLRVGPYCRFHLTAVYAAEAGEVYHHGLPFRPGGRHGLFDLTVRCEGDTDVDFHHSVEDVGICLGQAFRAALGDKRGIARFADRVVPMDDVAALVALDIGGRPYLNFEKKMNGKMGAFDAELVEEFLRAFAFNAGVNLYVDLLHEGNLHHEAEAIFKALAKCVQDAVRVTGDAVPSSKGVL